MNLKQAIQEQKTVIEQLSQVKTIVVDENGLQELENDGAKDYPLFVIEIISTNIETSPSNSSLVYYFNWVCLDAELQGKQNRVDCLSDTLGILQDAFSELFRNGEFSYSTNGQSTIITEAAPSHTAGWLMPIQVRGAYTSDTCFIP